MEFSKNVYFILLISAIVFVSITQVLFKLIADKNQDNILGILYDYRLYIAVFIYFISFAIWIVALSKIDYSIAIPANILTIILGGLFGFFIFNETIGFIKLLAYIFMIIGVLLLTFENFK